MQLWNEKRTIRMGTSSYRLSVLATNHLDAVSKSSRLAHVLSRGECHRFEANSCIRRGLRPRAGCGFQQHRPTADGFRNYFRTGGNLLIDRARLQSFDRLREDGARGGQRVLGARILATLDAVSPSRGISVTMRPRGQRLGAVLVVRAVDRVNASHLSSTSTIAHQEKSPMIRPLRPISRSRPGAHRRGARGARPGDDSRQLVAVDDSRSSP
jgi:hypothetical protein